MPLLVIINVLWVIIQELWEQTHMIYEFVNVAGIKPTSMCNNPTKLPNCDFTWLALQDKLKCLFASKRPVKIKLRLWFILVSCFATILFPPWVKEVGSTSLRHKWSKLGSLFLFLKISSCIWRVSHKHNQQRQQKWRVKSCPFSPSRW